MSLIMIKNNIIYKKHQKWVCIVFILPIFLFSFGAKVFAQNVPANWGLSADLGMNILHISTKNRFFELNEDIGSHYSEFKFENPNTNMDNDGKIDVRGKMRQFHLGANVYYNSIFSQIQYSKNITFDSEEKDSGVVSGMKTTEVSDLDISVGTHWQRQGAMSTLVFMLGVTRLGHKGFEDNMGGHTYFLMSTMRFAPMFSVHKYWEIGFFLEASAGIPILLTDTVFGKIKYNDLFDDLPVPETSGYLFRMQGGLQFFLPKWGVFFRNGVRMRMYEISAQGKLNGSDLSVKFSGNDEAFWYLTIGYYFSRPKYNFYANTQ